MPELRAALRSPDAPVVIDVRGSTMQQVEERRVPGALTLVLGDIETVPLHGFSGRPVVLYCACPNEASAVAGALLLRERGYVNAKALRGGIEAWIAAGHEVETGSGAAIAAVTIQAAPEIGGRQPDENMLRRNREQAAMPRSR